MAVKALNDGFDGRVRSLLRDAESSDQCVRQLSNAIMNNDLGRITALSAAVDAKTLTRMLWLASVLSTTKSDTIMGLIDVGADKMSVDIMGRTLIHEAASWLNFNVLEPLVRAGIPVDSVDNKGRTALIEVVNMRHADIATLYLTVKLLVDLGSNPGHVDRMGRDAPYYAILRGYVGLTDLLCQSRD